MVMRPPIDQTLWDAGQNDRGPYDSVFAPRPDMGGPVGPNGGGFGVPSRSFNSPMEATTLPWDAQQAPIAPSRIQDLARLLMGASGDPQSTVRPSEFDPMSVMRSSEMGR